jgi:putative glutathione S-transferase
MSISPELEAELKIKPEPEPQNEFPEKTVEQTEDGAFRRQRNWFSGRFGTEEFPVEPGRYAVFGSIGCGWARRQHIILRLTGLEESVPFIYLTGRSKGGWRISNVGNDIQERFGTLLLNDFYRNTDPDYKGRGTSPTVIDLKTGKVVSNNYHLLPQDWETVWKPFHKEGAPDLYPEYLRKEIDLLNQQIFDDINNGTYKVLFATNPEAAKAAYGVFKARLADLDFRLQSRRYLFGDKITDSDVRLFQTLASYEGGYRVGIVKLYGEENVVQLSDYPSLWGYARDLFANGFTDEVEKYFLGFVPAPSGEYQQGHNGQPKRSGAEKLAAWSEPHGRDGLTGSPFYSGPGGGGSFERWTFA